MRGSREIRDLPSSPSGETGRKLTVTETSGKESACEAILSDLTANGLVIDCPQFFGPNAIVRIEGKLQAGADSVHVVSRARVVSCQRISPRSYRVGVEFLDAAYRPVVA